MISKGATNGDTTISRKRYSREECMVITTPTNLVGPTLGFGPNDLEGVSTPHFDALVIRTHISNFDVDILYWSALEQMGVKIEDL